MKRMKKGLAVICAALVFVMSVSAPAFAEKTRPKETLASLYIKEIANLVSEQYRFGAEKETMYEAVIDYIMQEHPELLEGAISAALSGLDDYSGYLNRKELENFDNIVDPSYVGIGVELEIMPEFIEIVSVMRNGPAAEAGVKAGDRILEINGEDASGFSIATAREKIVGVAGREIRLTLLRENEVFTVTMHTRKVSTESVYYTIVDRIGYIQIARFGTQTPYEVQEAFDKMNYEGIKNIIFDVRGNPGGQLSSVLNTLYKIVPSRKLLAVIDYYEGRNDTKFYSNAKFTTTDNQYLVLIDGDSASAAELFAGAIRDNKLGVLMGERSFGKGTVQEFAGLRSVGGFKLGDIKLTVAQYLLPGGECINKKGIVPDIRVKNEYRPVYREDFMPMVFDAKYSVGDEGDAILGIEQRMDALGYDVGEMDGVFDEALFQAVHQFQKDEGLFPYGVMDITTQTFLETTVQEKEVLVDLQLEAAFDYFTEKAGK